MYDVDNTPRVHWCTEVRLLPECERGLFARRTILEGAVIYSAYSTIREGAYHVSWVMGMAMRTSPDPNVGTVEVGETKDLVALRPIAIGEELLIGE